MRITVKFGQNLKLEKDQHSISHFLTNNLNIKHSLNQASASKNRHIHIDFCFEHDHIENFWNATGGCPNHLGGGRLSPVKWKKFSSRESSWQKSLVLCAPPRSGKYPWGGKEQKIIHNDDSLK